MWIQLPFRSALRAVLDRPGRVLLVTALVTVSAALLGTQVELRTSRTELAPPDDPEQRRFSELVEQFNGSQALVVAVEALENATPEELRGAVERLAAALGARPEIESVFYRVDVPWVLRHSLYLAPPAELLSGVEGLRELEPVLEGAGANPGLAILYDGLAAQVEEGLRSGRAPGEEAAQDAVRLTSLLAAIRDFLEAPTERVDEAMVEPPLRALARVGGRDPGDGYLVTRDGGTLFLFVVPADPEDSLAAHRALVSAAREVAAAELPGFRVALTGNPATTVEEMDTVARDSWRTAAFALAGVGILTFLVFRWRSHAALVLLALGVGVTLAYGAVWLELGYLNLVTSAFVSTLIGVGVAYGIHPVSEYELEGAHTRDPERAVLLAYQRTGSAVATAAVTTSVAFFAILFMNFRAFAELGLVAGFGVLFCLAAALVSLPAMLVVHGRWRQRRDERKPRDESRSALDRVWMERGAASVIRFPRAVSLVAGALTLAAGVAALGIRFDINLLDLLPADAESARYQRRMLLESEQSPLFNLVVANRIETLGELEKRAEAEPTIREFQSLLSFLPESPEESRAAVAAVAEALDGLRWPESAPRIDRPALEKALVRLEGALTEAADEAFGAGLGEVSAQLEGARIEVEGTRELVGSAGPTEVERWDRALETLWPWVTRLVGDLRRAAHENEPTVESLPPELRTRFLTRDGRYLGYLLPAGEVFDEAFLVEYVAASRRVAPDSTGFPIVFHQMAGRITSGFYRAAAVGAFLVLLTLVIDSRDLRQTGLAVLPLAMGVVWMLGAMRLLDLSFNFANLVAVPLIIGVGIDNGVHVMHRLKLEGREGMSVVLRHTGRAILISSLTTMIGFGSLALASHQGLASLGIVLLIGVTACLVTSMVVLPNLLVAFGAVRR